ncbi:MAG: hydantoinase/oxoprolinase family protein [Pseudomonadota bacterium]
MTTEIGIDTGGTFTDLVCRRPNTEDVVLKVPSTPADPSRAIATGIDILLRDHQIDPTSVRRFIHGTTVATNAVLERKGAKVGIITTEGFRDALEIGRQLRTAIYDLHLRPETPVFLAPRARRKEVRERIAADGRVVLPLDDNEVAEAGAALIASGVNAVAVCFLFSFLNPSHEQRARDILREAYPHLALSLSSEVDPAFREYERVVATAFDAYTKPVLSQYLARIEDELAAKGIDAPLQVMQSRGGIAAAAVANERPVRLFLSGPAAGVIGAAGAGEDAGHPNTITVDIGGTSCDIALVHRGQPGVRAEGRIDGFPVRVPMVDVNAIGAGGGSLAWIDGAGGLRIGPQSAGADPGPACYDRGGTEPTVTDASLALGWLNPEYFAGGTVALNIEAARDAIDTKIAKPLNLSVDQAALGIHRVVNAQMAEGMRLVSIRQGFDPRDFSLVALGGAGPVHATALAEELALTQVIVPLAPGVLSADGLLRVPIEHEMAVGFPHRIDQVSLASLRNTFDQLDRGCEALMANEALTGDDLVITYSADVCYVGQSHYLDVELDITADAPLDALYEQFLRQHEHVYGYATRSPARIVNLRATHRRPGTQLEPTSSASAATLTSADRARAITLPDGHRAHVPIVNRIELVRGSTFEGPIIIEQPDTTTVVQPGWKGEILQRGQMRLYRETT